MKDRNGKVLQVGNKVIWYDPQKECRDLKRVYNIDKISEENEIIYISDNYSEVEVYPHELEFVDID